MNDFFKQEKFEDFFRENLEGYESEPSDSLWGRLQDNIPLKPAIGGGLVSSLATLVAVVGIGGILYFSIQKAEVIADNRVVPEHQIISEMEWIGTLEQQEKNPAQKQQQVKESLLKQSLSNSVDELLNEGNAEQIDPKSEKSDVTELLIESKELVDKQFTNKSQKRIEQKFLQKKTPASSSKKMREVDLPNTRETFTSKKIIATVTQTNTLLLSEGEKNKQFFSQKPAQLNSKNGIINALEQLVSNHAYRGIMVIPIREDKGLPFVAASNNAFVPSQEPPTPKVKTKTKQKGEWSLEVLYGPHIWTSLKAKKEGYETKQLLEDVHKMANYGVVFTERRKNGWGFEGGFIYGSYNLSHELNETLTFSYLNNFLDEDDILTRTYSLNIRSPFWKEDRPVNLKYTQIQEPFIQEGEEIQLKGYHIQKMNNFQITAGANYQMELSSKLNLVVQGGVAWSFLTVSGGSLSNAYLSNDALEIEQAEESEKRVFESIDIYIGAGLEYKLANQFKIKLAPRYVTTFRNRANHNDQINLRSLQLNVGLSYPLNK